MIPALDKRLALVEQAQALEHHAAEARWRSTEQSLSTLTNEVRQVNNAVQQVVSDPSSSSGGRQILVAIARNRQDIDRHEVEMDKQTEFRAEVRGGMKLLRAVVTISAFLSGVAATIQVFHLVPHL